jgi:hypothetical protein
MSPNPLMDTRGRPCPTCVVDPQARVMPPSFELAVLRPLHEPRATKNLGAARLNRLRSFSRLGPLGRLVIKAVEAALHVILLDNAGVRAAVDIEGCLARLAIRRRRPHVRPKRLDFGIAISASLEALLVGRGGRGDRRGRGGPGWRGRPGGRGAITSTAGDNDRRGRR